MTSRPEPRSAEERARELVGRVFALPLGTNIEEAKEYLTEKIITTLREYGEECYHKGFHENIIKHPDPLKEVYAQGWNDCKQKAIEIAGDHNGCVDVKCLSESNCGATIANQIHALTPSEGGTK